MLKSRSGRTLIDASAEPFVLTPPELSEQVHSGGRHQRRSLAKRCRDRPPCGSTSTRLKTESTYSSRSRHRDILETAFSEGQNDNLA